jgi:hypothetical protein
MRILYGVMATVGALIQGAFTVGPRYFPDHPMNFVGFNLASLMTLYCAWQFKHRGQGITKYLQARRARKEKS